MSKLLLPVDHFNKTIDDLMNILTTIYGESDKDIRFITTILQLRKYNKFILVESYANQFHTNRLKPLNDQLILRNVDYFVNTDLAKEYLKSASSSPSHSNDNYDENKTTLLIENLITKVQQSLREIIQKGEDTSTIFETMEQLLRYSLEYKNLTIVDVTTSTIHDLLT